MESEVLYSDQVRYALRNAVDVDEAGKLVSSATRRATSTIRPLDGEAKQTYKNLVYETLYELIQDLELPPGERLVEADLANRFGVSKTPVREALFGLESDRLVTTVPHVGATVTMLSIEDYQQHLFVLDALEVPALWLIVKRITPAQIQSCQRIVESAHRAHQKRDRRHYRQLVLRLHTELFATVGYPQLSDFIETVQISLRRYAAAFTYKFPETWEQEWKLVNQRFQGVKDRDPEAAAEAVRRGHAALLESARQRVESGDPTVMQYLKMTRERQPAHARQRAISGRTSKVSIA